MTYHRVAHVAWRRIGAETVVLDLKSKRVFALNEPGSEIWHALAPEGSAIAATSDEAGAFLAALAGHGLVEEAAPAGTAPPSGPVPCGGDPPRIIWQDDIRTFGVSCLQTPIQGGCSARPTS